MTFSCFCETVMVHKVGSYTALPCVEGDHLSRWVGGNLLIFYLAIVVLNLINFMKLFPYLIHNDYLTTSFI